MRKIAVWTTGLALLLYATPALAQTTTDWSATYTPEQAAEATAAATTASAGVAALAIGWIIFWVIFGGVGFVLWLWALIDCIRRQFPAGSNDKILWIVLILVIPWIGPIVYLIVGRKRGKIAGGGGGTPAAPAEKK